MKYDRHENVRMGDLVITKVCIDIDPMAYEIGLGVVTQVFSLTSGQTLRCFYVCDGMSRNNQVIYLDEIVRIA